MRVLAIDPGLRPGVVELDSVGTVLRVSHKLNATERAPVALWDLVATELQWIFHGSKVNPNNLLSLAFRAGFTLASIPAVRRVALKPQLWRATLGFGSGVTKEQVQKRIASQLTAQEKRAFLNVPTGRHGDVLDAIGIGRAAILLAHTTEHDVHFGK